MGGGGRRRGGGGGRDAGGGDGQLAVVARGVEAGQRPPRRPPHRVVRVAEGADLLAGVRIGGADMQTPALAQLVRARRPVISVNELGEIWKCLHFSAACVLGALHSWSRRRRLCGSLAWRHFNS